jgi:integrase
VRDLPRHDAEAWMFPSEKLATPLAKDNVWRRSIGPKLKAVGLDWVDFHVFRRTSSSLMNDFGVEGKLVSDQLGHTLDVNQNTYTQTSQKRRRIVRQNRSGHCGDATMPRDSLMDSSER